MSDRKLALVDMRGLGSFADEIVDALASLDRATLRRRVWVK
jgi:hypothetical protein